MASLREIEVSVSAADAALGLNDAKHATMRRAMEAIRGGGTVASIASGGGLATDFAPDYFVRSHPVSFPHGTGARPDKMSEEAYHRLLTERMIGRPTEEGGEDVLLGLCMFNVGQRHRVLSETRGRLLGDPRTFRELDAISSNDFKRVLAAFDRGACSIASAAAGLSAIGSSIVFRFG